MVTLVILLVIIIVVPVILTEIMKGPTGIDRPRPPRETMAPVMGFDETVEYLSYSAIGTMTVLDAQWLAPQRTDRAGMSLLAVQVQIAVTEGEDYISPFNGYAITPDGSRYGAEYLTDPPMTMLEGGDVAAGNTAAGQSTAMYPTGHRQGRTRSDPAPGPDGYEPIPAFEPCYAGDAITGWITREVPRQDVTLLFDNGNYKGSVGSPAESATGRSDASYAGG